MRIRLSRSTLIIAIAAISGGAVASSMTQTTAQDSAAGLKTSWGEPDLQGIWTDETDTPLQRSP
jgi:hypothetical protein